MSAPILGYFVDLMYKEDLRSETITDRRWNTAEDCIGLIGDDRVFAATWLPLVAAVDDASAVAWLVAGVDPGPYVTDSRTDAMAALDMGATVTGLQFAQPDKT